uniref:Uncharacterized protein n=1 Tax=Moniliophthora roreri TaxID=221103 RepID=A0A0W0FMW5_MONRR
MEDKGLKNPLV